MSALIPLHVAAVTSVTALVTGLILGWRLTRRRYVRELQAVSLAAHSHAASAAAAERKLAHHTASVIADVLSSAEPLR